MDSNLRIWETAALEIVEAAEANPEADCPETGGATWPSGPDDGATEPPLG